MKRVYFLDIIIFTLAFCSMVYELLLAQGLSAFLENTVLRYSVTIGLYMCSMGFGALAAEGRLVKHAVLTLLRVEILLTIVGGFALVYLHLLDSLSLPRIGFSIFAHTLIILIGVLTGFEIPLLIEIRDQEKKNSGNIVLAINYAGAFFGPVLFAFIFFPKIGLMPTAFFIGFLNALAGILLLTQLDKVQKDIKRPFFVAVSFQIFLLMVMTFCLANAASISDYFMRRYLGVTI